MKGRLFMKKRFQIAVCTICVLLSLTSCASSSDIRNNTGTSIKETAAPASVGEDLELKAHNNTEDKKIMPSDLQAIKTEFTEVGSYSYDMDNDGEDEEIILTINAGKNSNNEFELNDGQEWQFYIKDGEKCYMLIDKYVQLGSISFDIADYYISSNTVPTATAIMNTSSMLVLTAYIYDAENDSYTEKVLYDSNSVADEGINKMYSSPRGVENNGI